MRLVYFFALLAVIGCSRAATDNAQSHPGVPERPTYDPRIHEREIAAQIKYHEAMADYYMHQKWKCNGDQDCYVKWRDLEDAERAYVSALR